LAESNDLDNLIELTHAFIRIVKGYDDKQPTRARTFADIISGVSQHPSDTESTIGVPLLELLGEDDCIIMFNTLFIMKEKLSSTVYEWIIKDVARELLANIKQLKCY
jgi:hypothetical protein